MDLTSTPYNGVVRNASTELPSPKTLCDMMKTWAVKYATYGWHIVQVWGVKRFAHTAEDAVCHCPKREKCPSPGKHPVELGWPEKATCDLEVIKKWNWTNKNIGIVTGRISNAYVIDQDVKDPQKNGVENLLEWEADNVRLFPKFIVKTGGGGCHYYFPYPKDLNLGGAGGSPLGGVDIRADKQFVVAPPSRHYSGGRYVWGV